MRLARGTFVIVLLLGCLLAPLLSSPRLTQAQSNEVTATSTPNPTPGWVAQPGGVTPVILNTNFTATATFDAAGPTDSGANSVDFRWKHPKPIIPNRRINLVTVYKAAITYRIQRAREVVLTNTFQNDRQRFCNSRDKTTWQNLDPPLRQQGDSDKSRDFHVASPGARDGFDNYYRLVISVRAINGATDPVTVRFEGYGNDVGLVSSPRDEYIVACTTTPLQPGGDIVQSNGVTYQLRTTLDLPQGAPYDESKDVSAAYVIRHKASNRVLAAPDIFCPSNRTPVACAVMHTGVPKGDFVEFEFSYNNQKVAHQAVQDRDALVVARFFSDGRQPVVTTQDIFVQGVRSTADNARNNPADCGKYIQLGWFGTPIGARFELGKYVACQMATLGTAIVSGIVRGTELLISTNPWSYIQSTEGNSTGRVVLNVWRIMLGLVDVIVVLGLLVAAFSNIFRWLPIKLDQYQVKQALPGIVWGIVLANLSYFALHMLIESASILTQALAEFTAGQIGETSIGGARGEGYLMTEAYQQLSRAIGNMPWFNNVIGSQSSDVEVVLFGANAILEGVGVGVISFIALLVFILVILILYIVLMFLLYIRNWVIILLFILSPLAFFALGFAPFRSIWQKWWGTFWKWLLMLPVSLAVVAFVVIVTSGYNQALANERPGVFPYLFFNGVGLALLYFALRVPFMWGKLGNLDVMNMWRNQVPKAAGVAARTGWDWGGKALAQYKAKGWRADPLKAGLGGAKYREKIASLKARRPRRAGETNRDYEARIRRYLEASELRKLSQHVKKEPTESPAAYLDRLRRMYRDQAQGAFYERAAKANPVRAITGIGQVMTAWREGQKSSDERYTKQGTVRQRLMESRVPWTYISEQEEKHRKDYSEIEDPDTLVDKMNEARKWLMDRGYTPSQAGKFLQRAASASNLAKFIEMNPLLSTHKDKGALTEQIVAAKQLRKAYSIMRRTPSGRNPREAYEHSLLTGEVAPYSKGVPVDEDSGLSSGPVNALDPKAVGEAVSEAVTKSLSRATSVPGKAISDVASIAITSANLHVSSLASGLMLDKKSIDYALAQSRKLGLSGRGLLGAPEYYGLDGSQFQRLAPSLELAAKAARGVKQVGLASISEDNPLYHAAPLAKQIDGFSPDRAQQLDEIVTKVKAEVGSRTAADVLDRQTLEQLHRQLSDTLGEIHLPQSANPLEMQLDLQTKVSQLDLAHSLRQEAKQDGIAIDDVAYRRHLEDLTLPQVGRFVQNLGPVNPESIEQTIEQSPEINDIEGRFLALAHTDPVLHKEGHVTLIDDESVREFAREVVAQYANQVLESRRRGVATDAQDLLGDTQKLEAFRNWVRASMSQRFTTVSEETPSASTPSQAEGNQQIAVPSESLPPTSGQPSNGEGEIGASPPPPDNEP